MHHPRMVIKTKRMFDFDLFDEVFCSFSIILFIQPEAILCVKSAAFNARLEACDEMVSIQGRKG